MKFITWNIRGLNSIHKLDVVRNFVREQNPDFLLLQETKMQKEKAEQIKAFKNYTIKASSSEGASGGTMMLWRKSSFSGTILSANKYLMIAKISSSEHKLDWYIVNIYAPNLKSHRKKVWDEISKFKSLDFSGRWLIMGDFNVPLYDHEKMGGNASQIEGRMDLREFINKEGLMDLDLHGIQFTWSNKRVGKNCIQARLDRALISPDWTKDFVCKLEALQKVGSDHFPLFLNVFKTCSKKNFPFRFEKMWMQHPQFAGKLEEWWNIKIDGSALFRVTSKLKNVKKNVKFWNKNCFGNIF